MEEKLNLEVEQELTDIGQKIEAERNRLEAENNIIDDESLISQVIRDDLKVKNNNQLLNQTSGDDQINDDQTSYVDTLEPENLKAVQAKIDYLFDKGLKKGVESARADLSPLELDAFHDLLVGRLYGELKNRGLVK